MMPNELCQESRYLLIIKFNLASYYFSNFITSILSNVVSVKVVNNINFKSKSVFFCYSYQLKPGN